MPNDRTELINDRARRITERLVTNFLMAAVVPKPMTKFEWATTAELSDPSNLHRPYGWVSPFTVGGPHPEGCGCSGCVAGDNPEMILAPFCPTLIAEQTADLDDDIFEKYVDTLEFCTSWHIVHRDLSWEDRERTVDDLLYDTAHGSMELLNAIQMGILDRMTGEA